METLTPFFTTEKDRLLYLQMALEVDETILEAKLVPMFGENFYCQAWEVARSNK